MPSRPVADWRSLTAAEVVARLDLDGEPVTRLSSSAGPGGAEVVLPDDQTVRELSGRLAIAPVDRDSTLAARPDPVRDPELWWVLAASYRMQLDRMGELRSGHAGWAPLPDRTGPVGRHLFGWVFLALVPRVREVHAALGLTDEESWGTLAALGSELAAARALSGRPGLDASWGLPLVYAGVSFRLGRLAFDRMPPEPDPTGHGFLRPGEAGFNTHVPGGHGPLTAAAADASFARALDVARGLPEPVVAFGCHSWLMDSQLADYLPASSNIIAFQRRFTGFTDRERADWAPIEHLFRRRFDGPDVPPSLLDEVPQETSLHRAVVMHLRHGGHWYNQTGWFRVEGG